MEKRKGVRERKVHDGDGHDDDRDDGKTDDKKTQNRKRKESKSNAKREKIEPSSEAEASSPQKTIIMHWESQSWRARARHHAHQLHHISLHCNMVLS